MFRLLGLTLLLAYVNAKVDYTGHRLISIQAKNAAELEFLRGLEGDRNLKLDFWTEPSLMRPADIHVPPTSYVRLRRALARAGIEFEVKNENIQELIDVEARSMMGRSTSDIEHRYLRFEEIEAFVKNMAANYSTVSWKSIGSSFEGRDLIEVKVAQDPTRSKPVIVLECGTHAREWLSVSTCVNLIKTTSAWVNYFKKPSQMKKKINFGQFDWDNHSYVSFFGSSGRNEGIRQERQPSANRKFLLFKQGFPEWQEEMSHVMRKPTFWFPTLSSTKQLATDETMLRNHNWHIIPCHNPDGYEYTHSSTRLWRKNRQPSECTCTGWWCWEPCCVGTDLNRNWDVNFRGVGASSDKCHDTYHGDIAFSAPETNNLKKAITALTQTDSGVAAFFSIHCYSQLLLVPWGFNMTILPDDADELDCVAYKMVAALKGVRDTIFEVGTPGQVLGYEASGGAYDWTKMRAGIEYSFTYELFPGRGQGTQGFMQPESEIKPTAEETIASLREFAEMKLPCL